MSDVLTERLRGLLAEAYPLKVRLDPSRLDVSSTAVRKALRLLDAEVLLDKRMPAGGSSDRTIFYARQRPADEAERALMDAAQAKAEVEANIAGCRANIARLIKELAQAQAALESAEQEVKS